jgi:hypothetical protein
MKAKPKPIVGCGPRNFFCPFYGDCLDNAVKNSWPDWECGDCRYKTTQEGRPESHFTASNVVDFYELPIELDR